MITIIAEKPSVALQIAHYVGATKRNDGYMSGGGYAVTWAFGHLLEIFADNSDDWETPLPFIPGEFRLRIVTKRGKDGKPHRDPGYEKQLRIIDGLFRKSDLVINAGDAGREGELIQRYIYEYLGLRVPVKRLWISSLSDEAIGAGLRELHPASEFDSLFLAGKARNEADWLVGINATRAMTRAAGGGTVRSLGRVQTPTLALVCRRYLENRDFVPEKYWRIKLSAVLGKERFTVLSEEKYGSVGDGDDAMSRSLEAGTLSVAGIERKDSRVQAPLLFDLTAMQREANRRFSMTAQDSLNAVQALYEKKLVTYPRTGSRYVPEDVFRTFPRILQQLTANNPKSPAAGLSQRPLNRHCINAAKVTDHHALIPTGMNHAGLSEHQQEIYDLIVTRFFESLSEKCEMMSTEVKFISGGVTYTAKSSVVITPGWRSVRNEIIPSQEDEIPEQRLPSFREGDICRIEGSELNEGQTKPKPVYTEDTLLEAMKYAGREIQDEGLKEVLKDCGLGTPATRAAEIETIIRRGYVSRSGRQLVPTQIGLAVYEAVRDKSIADVEMTARWESALAAIADGQGNAEEFSMAIRTYTGQIVTELLSNDGVAEAVAGVQTVPDAKCPLCGKAILLTTRLARCSDGSCGWKLWRTVAGKYITDTMLESLLRNGRTATVRGFKSRTGKDFSASLVLKDGEASFEFGQKGMMKKPTVKK